MQRKAQEDAEGYMTPDSEEVSDAKSGFSDLSEWSSSERFLLTKELADSKRFRLTEEWSNSEEEREERKALFMLETIRMRGESGK
jgi:hypothetical protein